MFNLRLKVREPSFVLEVFQVLVSVFIALVLALDLTGIWSGFPWITQNLPSITFISICLLFVSAFLEKHFYFEAVNNQLNKKLDEIIKAHPKGIMLENRKSFDVPIENRMGNAKEVLLLSRSLIGILSHYYGFIEEKARNGCKFRILILDKNYSYSTGVSPKPWKGKTKTQVDIAHSTYSLQQLMSVSPNVEARFTPNPALFSLTIIDPSMPYGEIIVELFIYDHADSQRPHFLLTQTVDKEWYDFFKEQFEIIWNKSRTI